MACSTIQLLEELPKKIRQPVMVPFGDLAFFSGYLVHTNECLLKLGEKPNVIGRSDPGCHGNIKKRFINCMTGHTSIYEQSLWTVWDQNCAYLWYNYGRQILE